MINLPINPVSVAQIAAKWSSHGFQRHCSRLRAYQLLQTGRVPGAVLWQGRWMIPANAPDPRKLRQQTWGEMNATQIVKNLLDMGILQKPAACSFCNQKKLLIAHHPDYNYPANVEWACRSCHKNLHIAIKPANKEIYLQAKLVNSRPKKSKIEENPKWEL